MAKKPVKKASRADTWVNTLTGIGDTSRDKRTASMIADAGIDQSTAGVFYRVSDMAARIVDALPEEAMREGFEIRVDDDLEAAEALMARVEELNVEAVFEDALKKERIFGGAGMLVGGIDGANLEGLLRPLDRKRIGEIKSLNVFDAREMRAVEYYNNPLEPKFGEPKVYEVYPRILGVSVEKNLIFRIHESRVIRFSANVAKREDILQNMGWGDPILNRCWEAIRDFDGVHDSAAGLVSDFAQAVYKLQGLHEAMASGQSDKVIARIKLIDMSRSAIRGVLLDAENEDFDRKSTPVSGLAELIDRFANRLAAAAKMPVAMLMGQAPAGLNATGASDTRFYYDQVAAFQRRKIKPQFKALVELLMLEKGSATNGVVPEKWNVNFPPLWQLDDVQQAAVRLSLAQSDKIYLDAGVLVPEEVTNSRFGPEGLSMDVHIDEAARAAFEKEQADAMAQQAELMNARVPADQPGNAKPPQKPAPKRPGF